MVRVLPFPTEPDPYPNPFLMKVTLVRGDGRRVYQILPGGEPGVYQTWVRFNGKPHRAQLVRTASHVGMIKAQYDREIAALLADGWQVVP